MITPTHISPTATGRLALALLGLSLLALPGRASSDDDDVTDEIRDWDDQKRQRELGMAAYDNDVSLATALLEAGVSATVADWKGDTPLHWAAAQGHPEMAVLLLNYGADLEARNKHGRTPLHPANASPRAAGRVIEYYRRTYGHGETFLHTALLALGMRQTDASGWIQRRTEVFLADDQHRACSRCQGKCHRPAGNLVTPIQTGLGQDCPTSIAQLVQDFLPCTYCAGTGKTTRAREDGDAVAALYRPRRRTHDSDDEKADFVPKSEFQAMELLAR